jgi:hypothetical protein
MATSTWQLRNLFPAARGSRLAFVDIFAPPFTIHRAAFHRLNGKSWIVLPSAPKLGADGNVARDKHGKPVRQNLVTIPDKELREEILAWAAAECEAWMGRYERDVKVQAAFASTEIKLSCATDNS